MYIRGISRFALAATALFTIHGEARADEPDIFGRTGLYDMTASPQLAPHELDYAYIRGDKPSFAEQRGLAGEATIEVRRNFVYIQDTDGALTIPFQSFQDLFASFDFTLRELYRGVPDEFVFVYFFTAFRTGAGAFFYQPEANQTIGIGSPRHDNNGGSPREGFVFMNHYRSFEESFGQAGPVVVQAQARSVFNQEAGHRWASFVSAGTGNAGNGPDVLLGRDDGHWSYFLHTGTGGSPMEGNAWRDNGNGTFTTVTSFQNWVYSDLDLYLMGLKAQADIEDFFVIDAPQIGNLRDIYNQRLSKSSPPQIFQPVTVSGTRVDISIQDVVFVNGPRSPRARRCPLLVPLGVRDSRRPGRPRWARQKNTPLRGHGGRLRLGVSSRHRQPGNVGLHLDGRSEDPHRWRLSGRRRV